MSINCKRCGYEMRSGAKFCPKCGMPAEQGVPSEGTGKSTPRPMPVQQSEPAQQHPPAQQHEPVPSGPSAPSAPQSGPTSRPIRTGMCPHCQNPIRPEMRFCRHCGKSLVGIFCPLCQRVNQPGQKYCLHCGAEMQPLSASGDQSLVHPYGTGKIPPGMTLAGRYSVVTRLAQGGMGAVYEAKELGPEPAPSGEAIHISASDHVGGSLSGLLSRRLAIKEMSFSMLKQLKPDQRQAVIDGFHREFELLSQLSHPNLVQAYQFFEEQGRQYYVMEFIDGRTLENILEGFPSDQFLPLDWVMSWARQLCDALDYLHSQSPPIIYRDLKPSNVMEVTGTHQIKLFDFGIARFYKPGKTGDTIRFGTEGYLAPEIVAYHSQTSKQTDVYALGVLLHELLTRHDPQLDPWRRPPIRSINPDVPEHIASAIERALILDPGQRTPSAVALLKDLFGPESASAPYSPVSDRWSSPGLVQVEGSQLEKPVAGSVSSSGAVRAAGVSREQRSAPPAPPPIPSAPVIPSAHRLASKESKPAISIGNVQQLDLGCIQRGKVGSGVFQVTVLPSIQGQVKPASPG